MWVNKNLLTHEQKQQITILRNSPNNIVGLSGGKDSVATCIILAELDIPFKTVTAEVWWKEGITGENPYHFEFLREKLIPTLERWGVTCDVVRSDITAYDFMTTPIKYSKNHPERVGKIRGFPLCGACGIQRDCKTRPCEKYYKTQGDYNAILGFASNEKDRVLSGQKRGQISILSLLEILEHETFPICSSAGLLSPTYSFSNRGGCWFCPNQAIQEFAVLYYDFPNLWEELMEVQRMPNKVTELFTRSKTLYDIENEIKRGVQNRIFSGMLF